LPSKKKRKKSNPTKGVTKKRGPSQNAKYKNLAFNTVKNRGTDP